MKVMDGFKEMNKNMLNMLEVMLIKKHLKNYN